MIGREDRAPAFLIARGLKAGDSAREAFPTYVHVFGGRLYSEIVWDDMMLSAVLEW